MRFFALFVRFFGMFPSVHVTIEVKMAPLWAAAWRARRSLWLRNIALTAASRLPSCWSSSQRSCVKTSAIWRFCAGTMHLPTKLALRLRQHHELLDTVGWKSCVFIQLWWYLGFPSPLSPHIWSHICSRFSHVLGGTIPLGGTLPLGGHTTGGG